MQEIRYPRYDEMAERLLARFPEVSRQQAESARDLVRAVNPNYYDRRSKARSAQEARPASASVEQRRA